MKLTTNLTAFKFHQELLDLILSRQHSSIRHQFLFVSSNTASESNHLNLTSQMSSDFPDGAPLLRDTPPLHAVRPDHWPMILTALALVFALFVLVSFVFFACHWLSNVTTSPTSTFQSNQRLPPPPLPPAALCPAAVATLPVILAGSGQGYYCCAVCLADFEERERVKLMPVCGHAFHPECIDTWLLSSGSCPVCRCSDLSGSKAGELRVDVLECHEEGSVEHHNQRNIQRSSSCNSSVKMKENRAAAEFLQRSCSV